MLKSVTRRVLGTKVLARGIANAPAAANKTATPAQTGNTSNASGVLKAAAAGSETKSAKKTVDIPVVAINQYTNGQQNACGTTSLASLMNYWNPGKPANDRNTIDKTIRNGDMFSAPTDLVGYARKNGYRAALKADAGLNDIKAMLDKGVPVQVLIDPGSKSDTNLHYVAVTGYEADAAGNITGLRITDPAGARKFTMPTAEFMDKWSDLKMAGVSSGMNRILLTYVPNDGREIVAPDGSRRKANEISLPSGGNLSMFSNSQPGLVFAQGTLNVVNGWSQKDPAKILGGVVQAGAGVAGLGLGIAGSYTQKAGQKAIDWGKKQWNKGGVIGKVAGGAAIVGGAIAKGTGWVTQKAGNAVAWVGGKVGGAIVKVGGKVVSGVKKAARAVASGAKKVGNAVASGVKKVFKGW